MYTLHTQPHAWKINFRGSHRNRSRLRYSILEWMFNIISFDTRVKSTNIWSNGYMCHLHVRSMYDPPPNSWVSSIALLSPKCLLVSRPKMIWRFLCDTSKLGNYVSPHPASKRQIQSNRCRNQVDDIRVLPWTCEGMFESPIDKPCYANRTLWKRNHLFWDMLFM